MEQLNKQIDPVNAIIENYKSYIDERPYEGNISILIIKSELLKYKRMNVFSDEQINTILNELEEYENTRCFENPKGRQM